MRVLIFSHFFFPESFPINEVARGLCKRGHEVTVVSGTPNYPEGRFYPSYGWFSRAVEGYEGVDVRRVPVIPRGDGSGIYMTANYLSAAFSATCAVPFLLRRRFDVILVYQTSPFTTSIPAVLMRALTGTPILFWIQDLWPETLEATGRIHSRAVLSVMGRLVRFVYRRCALLLVQSEGFREPVVRMGGSPASIRYFPNPADESCRPLAQDPSSAEAKLLPAGFRVMFAGNIGDAQDFPTILEAASLLKHEPSIQWVILGDGSRRAWVEREVALRGLGGCFHLLGRHPRETMPLFFAAADVLLATLGKHPIFELTVPSKVQSYLACGRPIAAALGGEGGRLVTEAGAGRACPGGEPARLAEMIMELYRTPEVERRLMGERGRAYFEANFRQSKLLDSLEGWMREVSPSGYSSSAEATGPAVEGPRGVVS